MTIRMISWIAAFAPLFFASGGEAAVYRCAQPDGTPLYSDYPCQGGAVVDIHPGAADPAARERLSRAQAELDRAAVERRAREQFEAAQREQLRRDSETMQRQDQSQVRIPDSYYGNAYDFYAPAAVYAPLDRAHSGARRASLQRRKVENRVPQVVRTPHPSR